MSDLTVIEQLHLDADKRQLIGHRYRKEDLVELAYLLDFDIGCLLGSLDTILMYLECGLADEARKQAQITHNNFKAQRTARRKYWRLG